MVEARLDCKRDSEDGGGTNGEAAGLRAAGCLEEPEATLPRPLPRPEPLPRGLEKPPLSAAMAASSMGAGSTAATVPCCWWAWMSHNLSAF